MKKRYILNFVPTGMIPTKKNTRHVPVTPNEIIEQTIQAYEVGITIAHLHARDQDELGTYKASIYEEIFTGIRKYCPDLVLCASLSGRNFNEVEKRSEVLQLHPDMGSLTLGSLNFAKTASINSPQVIHQLIESMNIHGVKPELECFDSGMINYSKYLIKKGLLTAPFYYNILLGNIASSQHDLVQVGYLINDLPPNSYWALGGLGEFQLQANLTALANGGSVRVGIEDNIWFDSERKKLATNIDLVKRVHQMAQIVERPLLTAKEFGELGFYNQNRS